MAARRRQRPLWLLVLIVALAWTYSRFVGRDSSPPPAETAATVESVAGSMSIESCFEQQRSDVMVESAGRVQRKLEDDLEGSKHQRFIVELDSGHTVLISHNIDLAPRAPIQSGQRIEFRGEYEWNERGGVVHWTHHDPQGQRDGGWLRVDGREYR